MLWLYPGPAAAVGFLRLLSGRLSFPVNRTSFDLARIPSGVKQKVILGTLFPAVLGLCCHGNKGGAARLYFKLNPDLSSGVSDLNIEGFVSKQHSSLHQLFPVETCRAPFTLIASAGTHKPWTES